MKQMKFRTMVSACGLAVLLASGGIARAQSGDAILDLLIKKGVISQREANEVREQLDVQNAATVEMYNKTKVASWIDEMKWSSDLRLRAEYFDNEDQSSTVDRMRYRYRLRLGFTTKFTEWATIGVGLASGSLDDPVSTNETMGDSFQKDPIQIDLAYVTLQRPGWDWLAVTGGKMKNPIWQTKLSSPMVYDGDLTPEGAAEVFTFKLGPEERIVLFGNFGQWLTAEISSSSDTDGYLWEMQGGVQANIGGESAKKARLKATLAGGLYLTENIQSTSTGDSPNKGNATTPGGAFLDDFEVVSVRGELAWQVRDEAFLGTPAVLTLSGEYIKNLAEAYENYTPPVGAGTDGDQTDGYSGQIAFGGSKKKGEWQLAYQYKHLEADATLDAFTDSDWGTGGTDRKGHVIKFSYNLQDWWQLGATAFLTQKISDRTGGNNISGNGDDLVRLQFDTVFKF